MIRRYSNAEDDIIPNIEKKIINSYICMERRSRKCLIMLASRSQTPTWTKFKEAESSKKVSAFSFLSVLPSLSTVAAGELSLLVCLGDPEASPGQMGYVIPPLCSGLVRGWGSSQS